jgi:hypothetical protein
MQSADKTFPDGWSHDNFSNPEAPINRKFWSGTRQARAYPVWRHGSLERDEDESWLLSPIRLLICEPPTNRASVVEAESLGEVFRHLDCLVEPRLALTYNPGEGFPSLGRMIFVWSWNPGLADEQFCGLENMLDILAAACLTITIMSDNFTWPGRYVVLRPFRITSNPHFSHWSLGPCLDSPDNQC